MRAAVESRRAPVSGDVVTRCRSLNQRICSGVPSGRKRAAKNMRKAGLSCPQPSGMPRITIVVSSSCCWVCDRVMTPSAKPP